MQVGRFVTICRWPIETFQRPTTAIISVTLSVTNRNNNWQHYTYFVAFFLIIDTYFVNSSQCHRSIDFADRRNTMFQATRYSVSLHCHPFVWSMHSGEHTDPDSLSLQPTKTVRINVPLPCSLLNWAMKRNKVPAWLNTDLSYNDQRSC